MLVKVALVEVVGGLFADAEGGADLAPARAFFADLADHVPAGAGEDFDEAAADAEWPDWRGKALELGIGTVLHVPMVIGNRTTGVLSLFNQTPDSFGTDDEAIAHILARHASVALASARHEQTMARAVDARKIVGQAMGILMERFDLDSDRAFAILKRYSQDTNRKAARRRPRRGRRAWNSYGAQTVQWPHYYTDDQYWSGVSS
ncbi:ANTAR domain-containing protein [Kribbella sp. NPDC051587]|uniref:ANTAR domain-containing protein n=1 Tax=Kribbella sp. NPDC051587 TaxID=3364119 RepID=UPI0037887058